MVKIAFMGAGSTVFAKNILGDCMCREALKDAHFALYDIDAQRLRESEMMLTVLNRNINNNRATITAHCGVRSRKAALRGANFVVNAIQVGGYEPATVTDFEIPKKYGLRQTIADTLGIGGIFRGLRTIPVMLDFARDMEVVCPDQSDGDSDGSDAARHADPHRRALPFRPGGRPGADGGRRRLERSRT